MEDKKIIKVSWSEFINDIINLIIKLKEYNGLTFNKVYGIPRGGLIPAVIISHLLEIPLVISESKINSKTLVIDDISDSGITLKKLNKHHKIGMTATLWIMDKTEFTPDIYLRIKNNYQWVIFPWEKELYE